MRDIFERAAAKAAKVGLYIQPHDPSLAVKTSRIKEYLDLYRKDFSIKPHFNYQISEFLRLNIGGAAVAKGFEPEPDRMFEHQVRKDDFASIQNYHSSPAIIFTDYKKLRGRRGLGILIHAGFNDLKGELPVVFALGAMTERDGKAHIKRLVMPAFDAHQRFTGLEDMPVSEGNIILAMTYAAECAKQLYAHESLTPRRNYLRAQTMIADQKANLAEPKPV